MNLGLTFAITLFLLMLLFLEIGRRIGNWQLKRDLQKIAGISLAESAIFALMGLLIAFTFAGANTKLDTRRLLIVDEANAIETAYMRVDLLSPTAQIDLRQSFRKYVDSRLAVYQALPNIEAAKIELDKSAQLQKKLWEQAVVGCKAEPGPAPCMLLLPAVNSMIDITSVRTAMLKLHQPLIVFILLISLALTSSLLAGYSMARYKERNALHILLYVALTAITIYININMEYPRVGLINLGAFDHMLVDVRNKMEL